MNKLLFARQRGFTIMEAVVVIVITGIIGAIVAVFIKLPVRGYVDSVARAEAADMADNALRRLTRDLRLALPNSVRTNGTSIEYIETKWGLRYLSDDDTQTPGALALSWNDTSANTFTVVGGIPGLRSIAGERPVPAIGDSVVIYNLGAGQEPANAYASCAGLCNRAQIQSIDAGASTMTLATNPFAAQGAAGMALMSPAKRFHVVTGPVSYVCDAATKRLMRYWGYGFNVTQTTSFTTGSRAILAENVESCSFAYDTMASQHSALIGISLTMRVKDDNKSQVTLMHQIHVNNTP